MDETLYPASSGLLKEVNHRITLFVGEFFQIDIQKARERRQYLSQTYGTTLGGLVTEHSFRDMDRYFEAVHPRDISAFLSKDQGLVQMLSDLPVPKSVFTNSPMEHALRVLDFLEIRDQFEHIFDLRFNQLLGKPHLSAFRRVLRTLSLEANEALLVDDRLDSLLAFKELGGRSILIDEEEAHRGDPQLDSLPAIRDIKELPQALPL
jgi:putative hydrolase of the HAD superfamily